MNWIANTIAGNKAVEGFLAVQKFLSGRKTYLAGGILLLQGLTCLVDQVIGLNGLGDAMNWAKSLGDNGCLGKVAEGLGLLGLRAGIAKSKQ